MNLVSLLMDFLTTDFYYYIILYYFYQAVQEFTDLCKNSTVDAVESALPFWPRLFNKLAMVRSDICWSYLLCYII